MEQRSFAEKINNIIEKTFDDLNEMKRSMIIADSNPDEKVRLEYEAKTLKSLMSMELNLRKLNSVNSAALYQEKEKSETVCQLPHRKRYN